MKTKDLIAQIDDTAIAEAVAKAEKASTGEIRVLVTSERPADVAEAARSAFGRLGLRATRERNAVLIFIAPEKQEFAILGDEGIHTKAGSALWDGAKEAMQPLLKAGKYTAALVAVIELVGAALAAHFPPKPGSDTNELPNELIRE